MFDFDLKKLKGDSAPRHESEGSSDFMPSIVAETDCFESEQYTLANFASVQKLFENKSAYADYLAALERNPAHCKAYFDFGKNIYILTHQTRIVVIDLQVMRIESGPLEDSEVRQLAVFQRDKNGSPR